MEPEEIKRETCVDLNELFEKFVRGLEAEVVRYSPVDAEAHTNYAFNGIALARATELALEDGP